MTRKDYILIANVIKQNPEVANNYEFVAELCEELKKDNQNFSFDKFVAFIHN